MAHRLKASLYSQFAIVEWNDAHADFSDVSLTDVHHGHKPTIMHTAGWVLKDDPDGVSIAAEFCPSDGTYRGRTFIPRAIIIKTTPFTLVKKRPLACSLDSSSS
jgi:hypothetical protein